MTTYVNSINNMTGVVTLSKADIGLGNVDNVSLAGIIQSINSVTSVNGQTGTVVLSKSDVGLGNVANASINEIKANITTADIEALGFVPGATGSVSNADTVDGFHASAFALLAGATFLGALATSASTFRIGDTAGTYRVFRNDGYISSNGSTFYKIWHEGNDGPSSGLDADTLDGLHASEIASTGSGTDPLFGRVRIDDDGFNLDVTSGEARVTFNTGGGGAANSFLGFNRTTKNLRYVVDGAQVFNLAGNAYLTLNKITVNEANSFFYRDISIYQVNGDGYIYWNAAKTKYLYSGPGGFQFSTTLYVPQLISSASVGTQPIQVTSTTMVNNLNAQYLGGYQEAAFAKLTGATFSGNVYANDFSGNSASFVNGIGVGSGGVDSYITYYQPGTRSRRLLIATNTAINQGGWIGLYGDQHASYPGYFRIGAGYQSGASTSVLEGRGDGTLTWKYATQASPYTLWHSGNDGAASGLDADTVDGVHAEKFARANIDESNPNFTGAGTVMRLWNVAGIGADNMNSFWVGLNNSGADGVLALYSNYYDLSAYGANMKMYAWNWQVVGDRGVFEIQASNSTDYITLRGAPAGALTWGTNAVYHAGNLGTKAQFNAACSDGDFLFVGDAISNADTVDGYHASAFPLLSGGSVFTGAGSFRSFSLRTSDASGNNWSWFAMGGTTDSAGNVWHIATNGTQQDIGNAGSFHIRGNNGTQTSVAINQDHSVRFRSSSIFVGATSNTDGNQILHAGNWSTYCAAASHTHDDRYYTETESDARFLISNASVQSNLDTFYSANTFGFSNTTTGRPEAYGQGVAIVSSTKTYNVTDNWITQLAFGTSSNTAYFRTRVNAGGWGSWHTIWNSGNDGSGSGLDADLLDGYHASTATTGNTIAQRTADGYLFATFFNSNQGDDTSGATHYIFMGYGGDGYYRRKPIASVRSEIVTNASVVAAAISGAYGSDNLNTTTTGFWHAANYYSNVPDASYYHHRWDYVHSQGAWAVQFATPSTGPMDYWMRRQQNGTWTGWAKFWNSDNDGSGSGLDADLLDGYNSDTTATANTIVRRDASGFINGARFTPSNANGGYVGGDSAGLVLQAGTSQYVLVQGGYFYVSNNIQGQHYLTIYHNDLTSAYGVNLEAANDYGLLRLSNKAATVRITIRNDAKISTDGGTNFHQIWHSGYWGAGNTTQVLRSDGWMNGVTGTWFANVLESKVNNGFSAPLIIATTVKVTNLNADLVDGYHATTAATASTLAVRDSNANLTVGDWFASNRGVINTSLVSTDQQFGVFFENNGSTAYAIYREGGSWTHPYPDLRIAFHTGIKIGANAGYGGIKFYTDYDMATKIFTVNESDANVRVLGGAALYISQPGASWDSKAALIVGSGGDAYLMTRHIRGKTAGADNADTLYLNYSSGGGVYIGGNLEVTGSPNASPGIVGGNNGMATRDDISNMNTLNVKSGFYLYNNPANGYYGSWTTWIQASGHYVGDNYGFQIASGYWDDSLWFRKVTNNSWGGWFKLIRMDSSNRVWLSGSNTELMIHHTGGTANQRIGRIQMLDGAIHCSIVNDAVSAFHSGGWQMNNAVFFPYNDNALYLGSSGNRWVAVYAVNGTIQTSDANKKKDIADSALGLDFILDAKPKAYRWKEGKDNRLHHGLLAQDVAQLVNKYGDFGGLYGTDGLNYAEFVAPLIKAVQELAEEVRQMRKTH